MMTEQNIVTGHEAEDSISFAALPDQIVVIRIWGRGSFQNSVELRKLAEAMYNRPDMDSPRFVVDLYRCSTMDSTFMGVLASIGLNQLKRTGDKISVVNVNDQNMRLLKTLGLTQFMNVRTVQDDSPKEFDANFHSARKEDVSRTDRIIHMIEAHRELCEVDESNNLRFESVLKYLEDSLKKNPGANE